MRGAERFLAVFGPKNAGKTVYLASLYGSADRDGPDAIDYHISASEDPDDPTHNYLEASCRQLFQKQWPDGTVFDELKMIRFLFTANEVGHRVVIPDVAGEITARAMLSDDWKTAESELKAKVLEQYKDYHGYLIFVPADSKQTRRSQEFKWEVDALLTALKERTPDGGMIHRPVAVLVSKWDTVSSHPGPREQERQQAEKYVDQAYPELAAGLHATCANVRVFPVSATGAPENGLPPNPLQPYNLPAPLIWILTVADRVRLESAEKYLHENHSELFKATDSGSKRRHYDVALNRFQMFLNEVPRGELAERAKQRVTELKRASRRRRMIQISSVCLLVMLVVSLVFGVRDWRGYDSIHNEVTAPTLQDVPDDVIEKARSYLDNRWHWVAGTLGWKDTLRGDTDAYEHRYETHSFHQIESLPPPKDQMEAKGVLDKCKQFRERFKLSDKSAEITAIESQAGRSLRALDANALLVAIETLYGQNPKGTQRDELITQCEEFLDSYPDTPSTQQVERIQAELIAEKQTVDQDTRFAELEKLITDNVKNPWKQFQHCQDWLAENQENPNKAKAVELKDKYLKVADDASWRPIENYARKYPTQFANIIKKLDEDYLDRELFTRNRTQARKMKQQQLTAWDRWSYQRIQSRSLQTELTPEAILAIRDLCNNYKLNKQRPLAMRQHVDQWLRWFEELRGGKNISVTLQSVTVDKESHWDRSFFYPDVFVTVAINGKRLKTGEKELDLGVPGRGFPDNQMGTYAWKWGDEDVVVKITCTDYGDETLTFNSPKDDFMLRQLNGTIPFDGGRIRAKLSCSAAVPPRFPKYKEN